MAQTDAHRRHYAKIKRENALNRVHTASFDLGAVFAEKLELQAAYRRAEVKLDRAFDRRRKMIREARALGIGLKEIARAARLSVDHVNRIERGERR